MPAPHFEHVIVSLHIFQDKGVIGHGKFEFNFDFCQVTLGWQREGHSACIWEGAFRAAMPLHAHEYLPLKGSSVSTLL